MNGTGFMRIAKCSGKGIIRSAARHNLREIQAELGGDSHIDESLTHRNEVLAGPRTADEIVERANASMLAAAVDPKRLRKDAVLMLELLFSLPCGTSIDTARYFHECLDWAAGLYGGKANVLSAVIHRDEAAPHCHVLVLPLINGRMVGSDLMGGPQKLRATQTDFHHKVAVKYGLIRAPARLSARSKAAMVKTVLSRLRENNDPSLQSVGWPLIREGIESNPRSWCEQLGITIDGEQSQRKMKKFVDYVVSTGKGPRREYEPYRHCERRN